MQTETQSAASPAAPAHDLPGWLFAIIIVICLAGGVGFIWWFFSSSPPGEVSEIVLKEGVSPSTVVRTPRRGQPPPLPLPLTGVPNGTPVTVNWKATPLRDVLRDLSTQAGFPVRLYNENDAVLDRRLTMAAQDRPFWEVFHAVSREVGLQPVNFGGNDGSIRLQDVQPAQVNYPTLIVGPQLIGANSVTFTARADPADGSINHSLYVRLTVATEPHANILGVVQHATIESAVDQQDRSIAREVNYYPQLSDPRQSPVMQMNIPLQPNAGSERIKLLQGYIMAITCSTIRQIEIASPLQAGPTSQTIDGLLVGFDGMRRRGDQYEVTIEVQGGGGGNDPNIRHRFGHERNAVQVFDAAGRAYTRSGGSSRGGSEYRMTTQFRKPSDSAGEPARLVILVPEGMKEARIPFEFTDLPIPR